MYAWLNGLLAEKRPTDAVIDVQGIGYEVLIPLSTYDRLPSVDQPIKILTHFQVREDAQILYGFATDQERRLFRLLLTVNGIGPRIGLAALGSLTPNALTAALATGDVKTLGKISGVGKKMAERLAVELRDKFTEAEQAAALGATGTAPTPSGDPRIHDATQALIALGYKPADAEKALTKIASKATPDTTVESLIRLALGG